MIQMMGEKVTATQFAKKAIMEFGVGAFYWFERYDGDYQNMTQREVDEIDKAIDKQVSRLEKLFGIKA